MIKFKFMIFLIINGLVIEPFLIFYRKGLARIKLPVVKWWLLLFFFASLYIFFCKKSLCRWLLFLLVCHHIFKSPHKKIIFSGLQKKPENHGNHGGWTWGRVILFIELGRFFKFALQNIFLKICQGFYQSGVWNFV